MMSLPDRGQEGRGLGEVTMMSLPSNPSSSCPDQLLHQVTRHTVQEQAQHHQEQQGQHDLNDQPLVPVADEVSDRFEGAQEPEERGVRAAVIRVIGWREEGGVGGRLGGREREGWREREASVSG